MILQEVFDTVEIAWSILGENIKIFELGDQRMKWHSDLIAKKFFINNGAVEHISVDLNGQHGALKIDLSQSIIQDHPKWKLYFDFVTNYGTAEHVLNGIYECYKNMHEVCRNGGIIVNDGPPHTCCPWHSPYHYRENFFEELAKKCKYKILLMDKRIVLGRRRQEPKDRTLIIAEFQKINDDPFISKNDFISINGIQGMSTTPSLRA